MTTNLSVISAILKKIGYPAKTLRADIHDDHARKEIMREDWAEASYGRREKTYTFENEATARNLQEAFSRVANEIRSAYNNAYNEYYYGIGSRIDEHHTLRVEFYDSSELLIARQHLSGDTKLSKHEDFRKLVSSGGKNEIEL